MEIRLNVLKQRSHPRLWSQPRCRQNFESLNENFGKTLTSADILKERTTRKPLNAFRLMFVLKVKYNIFVVWAYHTICNFSFECIYFAFFCIESKISNICQMDSEECQKHHVRHTWRSYNWNRWHGKHH